MTNKPDINAVLTIVDTAGIQSYVFASNRLREAIGASWLVSQATDTWVRELLPKPNNLDDQREIIQDLKLAGDSLASELIYAGGGGTAILFSSLSHARTFARNLSHRVLDHAPGLRLVIAHSREFSWSETNNDLAGRVTKLLNGRLAEKKRSGEATPLPLLGLSVTAECTSTGLPVTHTSNFEESDNQESDQADVRQITAEIACKLDATHEASYRLQNIVSRHDPTKKLANLEFTDQLDLLGRTHGAESYVAVVHIDGNDIGSRISGLADMSTSNRDYINNFRDFSHGVSAAADAALADMLTILRDRVCDKSWEVVEQLSSTTVSEYTLSDDADPEPDDQDEHDTQGGDSNGALKPRKIALSRDPDNRGTPLWPVRPVVLGGDDVTFVCNGQLGLALATIYMGALYRRTKESAKLLNEPVHTSAGVSIVKVHYPFRRAYDLSEQLTASAKNHLGEDRATASSLDWHYSSTGLAGDLELIREREYTVLSGKSLSMRPVRFANAGSEWKTWVNFDKLVRTFVHHKEWRDRRNKLKALREALRQGPEAVKRFLDVYGLNELPNIGLQASSRQTGWRECCVYFDALEAMDHHLPMESE